MKIYGKIISTNPKERIIKVLGQDNIIYLYMSRRMFKDFGPYFIRKPYIFVNVNPTRKHYGIYYCYEVENFNKIVQSTKRERIIYYNIATIRKGVKRLLENTKNKLFLDLEFSLPSYFQTMQHIPEIVQYGIVVEDENGNIVFEDGSLVKPYKKYAINIRTLKFLSKSREDFDYACSYIEFYQLLERCIEEYDAKIIAWGKNDILAMEQSFKLNRLKPLDIRNRYINLMQVIKNYYNQKTDLGLFNTYQDMSGIRNEAPQIHDALEDALMAREIYRMFKNTVEKEFNRV